MVFRHFFRFVFLLQTWNFLKIYTFVKCLKSETQISVFRHICLKSCLKSKLTKVWISDLYCSLFFNFVLLSVVGFCCLFAKKLISKWQHMTRKWRKVDNICIYPSFSAHCVIFWQQAALICTHCVCKKTVCFCTKSFSL